MAHFQSEGKVPRYVEKLTIRDEVLPDPYSIGEESWTDDMTQWPDLVYGDLYSYLIETKGPYCNIGIVLNLLNTAHTTVHQLLCNIN